MFKLASLFVEIKAEDAALKAQLGGVQQQLGAMGVAVGSAVGGLAASAIQTGLSALTGFFAKGIAGATNLAETQSKVQTIFGDSAATITKNADDLAKAFGLPKQAILDASASIGLVGKAAGQSQAGAADLGAKMAKLAADASSFYNVPLEEALGKIRSGLVGEAEPLRAFGVLLTEEAVASEAVALGLAKSAKEVDNQAKVAARASLITKGLGDATGDLERTSGSTANQWRKFTGTLESLAVTIGGALSPAISGIITLGNEMGQALVAGIEASKGTFAAFAEGVTTAVNTIGVVFRNLPDVWEIVTLSAQQMFANVINVLATLPENVGRIASWIGRNWYNLLRDGVVGAWTVFKNFGENIYNLGQSIKDWIENPTKGFHFEFKPLLQGFKATTEALPELLQPQITSMQDQIDAAGQRIADRETKRAEDIAAKQAGIAKAGNAAAAQAAKKTTEFKSETLDVAEFTTKLRASIFGSDDTAKQQLAAAKQTAENTKKLAEAAGKKPIAILG